MWKKTSLLFFVITLISLFAASPAFADNNGMNSVSPCPATLIANGSPLPNAVPGTVAMASCNDGYFFPGGVATQVFTCSMAGQWGPIKPNCSK